MGSKFIKVHKYSFQFVSKYVCNGERGMYMEGFLVGKVCMFPKTNQNDYLCYMFFWGNYLFFISHPCHWSNECGTFIHLC